MHLFNKKTFKLKSNFKILTLVKKKLQIARKLYNLKNGKIHKNDEIHI